MKKITKILPDRFIQHFHFSHSGQHADAAY
jgi:hypothetical protein